MSEPTWVPVWEKEGNQFFITLKDWCADSYQAAQAIRFGAIPEAVLLGMRSIGVLPFDMDNVPHVSAWLGDKGMQLPVAVIAGPLFDREAFASGFPRSYADGAELAPIGG